MSTGLDVCSSTVECIKYEVLDGNGTTTELLQTEAMVGLSASFSWSHVKILSIFFLYNSRCQDQFTRITTNLLTH